MPEILDPLLLLLDQCFDKQAWHGPHLKASIRGVDAKQALWRPQPKRHSIAEQVLHTAYWKYAVRRRLRGDKRGSFPLKGSNWFAVTAGLSQPTWDQHRDLLDQQHKLLRQAVIDLSNRKRASLTEQQQRLISGVAAHDVYHAGQIRLLRSMYEQANRKGTKTRRKK